MDGQAEAAGGEGEGSNAAATAAVEYLGAMPFEFGAFSGYQHRATSKVDGGDGGALDVATRCLTHVWRLPAAAEPAVASGPPSCSSDAGVDAVRAQKMEKERRNLRRRRRRRRKRSRDSP